MDIMDIIVPIKTYAEWKERALDLGTKIEAAKENHAPIAAPRDGRIPPDHGGVLPSPIARITAPLIQSKETSGYAKAGTARREG